MARLDEEEHDMILVDGMSELNVDAHSGKKRQVSVMHPDCFSHRLTVKSDITVKLEFFRVDKADVLSSPIFVRPIIILQGS